MLTKKGYIIQKKQLSVLQTNQLIDDLCVQPLTQGDYFAEPKYPVYRESETRYRIPRFYGIQKFGLSQDSLSNGISINLDFNGTLNDSTFQNEACSKVLTTLYDKGGGILSLGTGFGKTTCALYILSKLKLRTLIIVHKEFLMSQWIERIQQFLPDASIGKIQQNKVDVVGKDIVIAMLQSIALKTYDDSVFQGFGFTIIDETHHICSKTFSRALFNVTTKYVLGLSATPERKDGLSKVLYWFIGDIIFSAYRKDEKDVQVLIKHYTHDNYSQDLPKNVMGKINLPEVINQVTSLEDRNDKILEEAFKCLHDKRKIILLTDRRNHCFSLYNKSLESGEPFSFGLYIGGMKQSELKQNENCDLIFATFSLANEGLDIPSLNTLILASPKTDIVQSVGRILRETGEKTHVPLVIDFVDAYGPLVNQFYKRKKFYTKTGFTLLNHPKKEKEKEQINSFLFSSD
tara:strand:- start:48 stop:1427 length:1380 start_codon:yes stop_codon:yes gene_type:complete